MFFSLPHSEEWKATCIIFSSFLLLLLLLLLLFLLLFLLFLLLNQIKPVAKSCLEVITHTLEYNSLVCHYKNPFSMADTYHCIILFRFLFKSLPVFKCSLKNNLAACSVLLWIIRIKVRDFKTELWENSFRSWNSFPFFFFFVSIQNIISNIWHCLYKEMWKSQWKKERKKEVERLKKDENNYRDDKERKK